MAYGFPIKYKNDPYIELAERALKSISESALPGKFLVNLIPALKYVPEWVPGAGFQKVAKEWKKIQIDFREAPFAKTVNDMVRTLLISYSPAQYLTYSIGCWLRHTVLYHKGLGRPTTIQ